MIGGSPSDRGARSPCTTAPERLPRREASRGLAGRQVAGDVAQVDAVVVERPGPRPGRPRRTSTGPTARSARPTRAGRPDRRPRSPGNRPTGVETSASSSAHTGTSGHSRGERSNASRSGRISSFGVTRPLSPSLARSSADLLGPLVTLGSVHEASPGSVRGCRGDAGGTSAAAAQGSASPSATPSCLSSPSSLDGW